MPVLETLSDDEFFRRLIELETLLAILSNLYGGSGSEGQERLLRDVEARLRAERSGIKKFNLDLQSVGASAGTPGPRRDCPMTIAI